MRPFTFINIASSVDGKISNEKRVQVRISCQDDLKRVDELRAKSDAIMVGIGTVLADNPKLTVKSEKLRLMRVEKDLPPNPLRVIVDSRCRIPLSAKVLDKSAETIVAVSKNANLERVDELRKRGVNVFIAGENKVDLKELMNHLYKRGVRTLMVEGGATLNWALLKDGLVDEIYIYYGNIIIGGLKSPTIVDGNSFDPPIKLELICLERMGNGILTKWRVLR